MVQRYHIQLSGLWSMHWSIHFCTNSPHQAASQSRITMSSDGTGEWGDSRWTRHEVRKWGVQGAGWGTQRWPERARCWLRTQGWHSFQDLLRGQGWALLTSPSYSPLTVALDCSFLPLSGSELELLFQHQLFQGRLPSFYPEDSTYQKHHSIYKESQTRPQAI